MTEKYLCFLVGQMTCICNMYVRRQTLSGSSLFTSQATTFVESLPFLIKISAVIAGAISGVFIQRRLKLRAADWDISDTNIESSATALAAFSLVCWIGAIFAGRLIAYL